MPVIKPTEIQPGMFVRVYQKIKEGKKERIQRIEGLVLARKHGSESGATFTIRRIIKGVGIEWILPLFSPHIEKIELIKAAKVRKAKLYYIREKSSRQARKKLKQTSLTKKKTEEKKEEIKEEKKEEGVKKEEKEKEQKEEKREEQEK